MSTDPPGGTMKKICTALLGLLIVTNISWISCVYYIEKEKRRVIEINGLLTQINQTLNQKMEATDSIAPNQNVLFNSLDRAIRDLSMIMREYTQFQLLKYRSKPGGPTVLSVEDRQTKKRLEITLPVSIDAPPDLFRIPTSRP